MIRVIPTLLLKNRGLVKGTRFGRYKYVGDPVNAVKIFNDKEVDELIFLDISATPEKRSPNFRLLKDIASQAFMPFAYGGGVSSAAQVEQLFRLGVEKVIINTMAACNLEFIKEVSVIAGAQSIVASIDVKKTLLGRNRVYSHCGTVNTKMDPVEFAKQVEEAGAGEIMVCSIDREGTGRGYDFKLTEQISRAVSIPVIASGGAGSFEDFKKAVSVGASAVAAGSMFVFYGKHKAVLITYPGYHKLKKLFEGV